MNLLWLFLGDRHILSRMLLNCGHDGNENIITVTKILDRKSLIICQQCYDNSYNLYEEDENPILQNEVCTICCQQTSVRYNPDLAMNICDSCKIDCINLLNNAEKARIPPPNVVPDEIVPLLFIGCKDSAYNLVGLNERNIRRILICCDHLPAYHHSTSPSFRYHRLPMKDSTVQNLEVLVFIFFVLISIDVYPFSIRFH